MCPGHRKVELFGLGVDALSMRDVVAQVERAVESRRPMHISVVNVAKVVNMRQDPLLRESVESGNVVLADGMPLVWLSRFKGAPLPERIAGIDLMHELLRLADAKGLRVFLLGARPETLERTVAVATERYPRMTIAGFHHGYFDDQQEEHVARMVREARPDILLVGISSPKKEVFMQRWAEVMDVPVCHGVGGSFDVMAGLTRRAPRWMQRSGLEWMYRLVQEPRRMWKRYLVTNSVFLGLALREICHHRRAPRGQTH